MGWENAMAEPHKIYLNFYSLTFFSAVFLVYVLWCCAARVADNGYHIAWGVHILVELVFLLFALCIVINTRQYANSSSEA